MRYKRPSGSVREGNQWGLFLPWSTICLFVVCYRLAWSLRF